MSFPSSITEEAATELFWALRTLNLQSILPQCLPWLSKGRPGHCLGVEKYFGQVFPHIHTQHRKVIYGTKKISFNIYSSTWRALTHQIQEPLGWDKQGGLSYSIFNPALNCSKLQLPKVSGKEKGSAYLAPGDPTPSQLMSHSLWFSKSPFTVFFGHVTPRALGHLHQQNLGQPPGSRGETVLGSPPGLHGADSSLVLPAGESEQLFNTHSAAT